MQSVMDMPEFTKECIRYANEWRDHPIPDVQIIDGRNRNPEYVIWNDKKVESSIEWADLLIYVLPFWKDSNETHGQEWAADRAIDQAKSEANGW